VAALESRGVKVRALQGDVSNPEDVTRMLAEPAKLGWPAVKGVFHLAGALADAVIQSLDGPKLRAAMAAKVSGGWNLHRATRSAPLDHFVLFSSIAALGTPGQAGHAAANAFLDALAHQRRAAGLPALSVGLGAFAEIGAAARLEAGGGRGAPGVLPMPPRRALDAVGTLLSSPSAHAVISHTDWEAFAGAAPPGARAFLAPLLQRSPDPAAAQSDAAKNVPTALRAQPRRERTEALEQILQRQVAALLGLPPAQAPGREQPLMQAGVDSLMAVHLRNALRANLDVELSVTVMFDNPTIAHLATHIAALLETTAESADPDPESLESMLAEVENLTDDEVERRLRKSR
jgi:myxalamid-type polyketide synthase MxaE and MxaD